MVIKLRKQNMQVTMNMAQIQNTVLLKCTILSYFIQNAYQHYLQPEDWHWTAMGINYHRQF